MGLFDNLFNYGGKPKPKLTPQEIFYKEIKEGNKGNVISLMQSGYNIFLRDKDQLTPLHIASWHNHLDLVRLFIEKGADVNAKSVGGGTALHLTGNLEVLKYLIKSGANIHAKRDEGDTPLHRASNGAIAEYLITRGLDVNERNVDGLTPFHRATQIDVWTVLLDNGADINAVDKYGRTRIFNACRYGNTEWVKFLLERGSDPNVHDKNGTTPLILACMNDLLATNHNAEIVRQLLIHGAEVNLNTESGKKSIEYAKRGNHTIIIQLLEYVIAKQPQQNKQHAKDSSINPPAKNDLVKCINDYGFSKTIDALQALNTETRKILQKAGSLESHEERYEFDLFAFSYYLIYLKNKQPGFENTLNGIIINFYSELVSDIAKMDPVLESSFSFLIKDRKGYVNEKLEAYRNEITNIINNPGYLSKYTFASFYMYPLMRTESVKKDCQIIIDKNVKEFQIELNGVMAMLEENAKNILKYVDL